MDIDEIFKSVNSQSDAGDAGDGNEAGSDGSGIPTKSAAELEAELEASKGGAAIDGAGTNGGGTGDGSNGDGSSGDGGADGGEGEGDVYDSEVLDALFGVIAEKNGFDIGDKKLTSPDELVSAIEDLINSKSKPKYTNDLSEMFDAFLADGGSPIDFFSEIASISTLPKISTQKEQEDVIKTVLKDAGFSEKQIERKIDLYIENETLASEAEDALDILKRKNVAKAEENATQQRKAIEKQQEDDRQFFVSLNKYIDDLKEVGGIPVTPEQRKDLKDYMFKVDQKDGMTGYQRDSIASHSLLVDSAFFARNRKSFVRAAEGKGSSDALSKFQAALKQKTVSGAQRQQAPEKGESLSAFLKQAAMLRG
jgi:hypothetical protein